MRMQLTAVFRRLHWPSTRRSAWLLAAAALAMSATAAWFVLAAFDSLRIASAWVAHSQRVQLEITVLRTSLANAHYTSERFHLTRAPAMRALAETHLADARSRLRSVQTLTADNPIQQRNLVLMQEPLQIFMALIEARIGDSAAAAALPSGITLSEAAMQAHDNSLLPPVVRESINRARDEEDRLLGQRVAEVALQEARLRDVVLLLAAASFISMLFAVWLLQREAKRLQVAQDALAQSNRRLEERVAERTQSLEYEKTRADTLLNAMSDGVIVTDADDVVTFVSNRAAALTGRAPASMLGRNLWDQYPALRGSKLHQLIDAVKRDRQPRKAEIVFPEYGGACLAYHLVPDQGGGVAAYFGSVTQRHYQTLALQDLALRMRRLSEGLVNAWEQRRRVLARELHDELGQSLTAIKLHFAAMRKPDNGALAARAADGLELTEAVITQVRDRALELRPALLDDFGLTAAIDEYLQRQAARSGITILFAPALPLPRLAGEIETAAFRVVQEAVHNAIKHAHCTRIEVSADEDESSLLIVVRDDGQGFVPGAVAALSGSFGMGVGGMRERVGLLGGRFAVESAPGRGTVVRASFPLPGVSGPHESREADVLPQAKPQVLA